MSKEQSKSDVARRREQLRRKQEKRQQQNRMIQIGAGIAAVAIVVVLVFAFVLDGGSDPEDEAAQGDFAPVAGERPLAEIEPVQRANAFDAYPEFVIDTANSYEAVIQTDVGEMRLELFDDEAPQTVNSFVFLANQGFYDGIAFHRVIDGFMAQGGDPTGTGAAGPGYSFADEFDSGLTFDRPGLLAMANSGPNTNGSQFFITFVPTPHLDGAHTIFGEVIEGQEVLAQITRRTPDNPNGPPGTVIERIEIYEAQGG